jgi:hypothetical protein
MLESSGNVVSFDTAKAVLVPAELYEPGAETEYLRFNGMALAVDEVALASKEQDGIVAVMAVPASEWSLHKDEYERGGVSATSPLLAIATARGQEGKRGGRAVDILLTAENVYIAVWEKGLRMAEALPDNSPDSILYYMQVLGRGFKLRKFDVFVDGEHAGIVCDVLRRYYKNVKCGGNDRGE